MNFLTTIRRGITNLRSIARGTPPILLANVLVTRQCSQRCLMCAIPEGANGNVQMSFGTFTELVDRLDRDGTHFVTISGGEPLCHPELADMIRYAAGKRFSHLQVLSNFFVPEHYRDRITEVLLETGTGIQISFDGFGEVADRLRGAQGVAGNVTAAIIALDRENRKRRKRIRTSLNIVLSGPNLHQVPELIDFAEAIGWKANVDLYRCSAPHHRRESMLNIVDMDMLEKAIVRIRRSAAVTTPKVILAGYRPFLEGKQKKRCPYLECTAVVPKVFIGPDGEVNICSGKPVGNILAHSPGEIFGSDDWRSAHDFMEQCGGCWNTCYTPLAVMLRPRSSGDWGALWTSFRKQ